MNNVFRNEPEDYVLTEAQASRVGAIKAVASELLDLYDFAFASGSDAQRQLALARTNLEQSVMWAVKGITG